MFQLLFINTTGEYDYRMSYCSESELPYGTSVKRLKEVIHLLGYRSVKNDLKMPESVGCYFWHDPSDYKSWAGVELDIYLDEGVLKLGTRTRISRSFWDLTHQNKTIKLVRDLFGGSFVTDVGKNRYLRPDRPPPSPVSSGCYLARWRFHNAMLKARLYLSCRGFESDIARDAPSALPLLDEMNPRLLSNNLIVPFIVAVWEEYYRATFSAVLCYANKREVVLKKARLGHAQLEQIAAENKIERAIADCFSFQRPSSICENFRMIDSKLDLAGAMRKPYKKRKASLYEIIETLVEKRNAFVHEGEMEISLFDNKLQKVLRDFEVAVDRSYDAIGKHFEFTPIREY